MTGLLEEEQGQMSQYKRAMMMMQTNHRNNSIAVALVSTADVTMSRMLCRVSKLGRQQPTISQLALLPLVFSLVQLIESLSQTSMR